MSGFQRWMLMPVVATGFGFFGMWMGYKRQLIGSFNRESFLRKPALSEVKSSQ